MNWKTDLKLTDLDHQQELEVTCRRCGKMRYERKAEILLLAGMRHAYLDEVEKTLSCADRRCGGGVRINLTWDDRTQGFVGGMA